MSAASEEMKQRSQNAGAVASVVVAMLAAVSAFGQTGAFIVVDTMQANCYSTNNIIAAPSPGQPFYGQDAQGFGNQSSYTLSGDGKTVHDYNTGLTWMRSPNLTLTPPVKTDRMIFTAIPAWVATVNATNWGGFNDWRLPTLKELYSLFDCRGTDPSSFSGNTAVLTPFIDTNYFLFAWGNTNIGERLIDQQYASSITFIKDPSESGYQKDFGVNFADGRIKGYDETDVLSHLLKTFYVQLVRGPSGYGVNSFTNNGDGTITDNATGLMWSRNDSGIGMNWSNALAWVQTKNTANFLGHNDWRMPNVKELQSILNYSNAPDFNGLPAIDTNYFSCTPTNNEAGQPDYPYYWTSSTHAGYSTNNLGGGDADYVAFGRALGWPSTNPKWVDVHGAGAQRSDPKTGPPYNFPALIYYVTNNSIVYKGYSFGPQGDAIRSFNFVRLVRAGNNSAVDHVGDGIPDGWRRQYFGGSGTTTNSTSCSTSDTDLDGMTVLQEYLADTNPTNGASRLALTGVFAQTNGLQISWIGGTAVTQIVESRRDLASTNDSWTAIATNNPPTATTNSLALGGATNVFYRIRTMR